jgi:hypothetical protein
MELRGQNIYPTTFAPHVWHLRGKLGVNLPHLPYLPHHPNRPQDHIYNDTNINQAFATSLRASCTPQDRRLQRHGAAGRHDAQRVRQRLLQEPAVAEGAPALDRTRSSSASNPSAFSSAFATAIKLVLYTEQRAWALFVCM